MDAWYTKGMRSTRPLPSPFPFLVLFGLCLLLACPATASADELPFLHYDTEHTLPRLPSTSVQNVHQDRLGYLWLSFFSTGLARYDGRSVESFGLRDGIVDPTVREIVEDADGRLWLGTEAGVVVSDRPLDEDPLERPRFVSAIGGVALPQVRVRHHWLEADDERGVWLGTAGRGLIHLDVAGGELRTEVLPLDPGMEVQPPVSALLQRRDGSLWIALGSAEVRVLPAGAHAARGEELFRDLPFDAVPETPLAALAEGDDGTVWGAGVDGSLWRWSGDAFELLPGNLGETVKALLPTSDGALWAGSLGGGVLRWRPDAGDGDGEVLRVGRAMGLPSATVWDLAEDREGTLWLGHNAGLSKLRADQEAFRHVTGRAHHGAPALPEPTVFGVLPPDHGSHAQDADGQDAEHGWTWVGTGGGLAILGPPSDDGRQIASLGVGDGASSNSIYALERDARGRVWLGTAAGLDVLTFEGDPPPAILGLEERPVEILGRRATLGSYGLTTTYAIDSFPLPGAEDGATCLAHVGGVACLVDERWLIFGPPAGLPPAGATCVTADPSGRLWVGTKDAGLLRSREALTPERVAAWSEGSPVVMEPVFEPAWTAEEGALSQSIRSLVFAGDRLWVAHAAGLEALDPEHPAEPELHLGWEEGLGGDHVVAMAPDSRGDALWVAANAGLVKVDLDDGEVLRRVTRDQGLIDDEIWVSHSLATSDLAAKAGATGDAGNVYFGTPRGLTIYRPALDRQIRPRPKPRFRRAEIRQSADGANRVELAWAPLTYLDEDDVRYSTRLRGLDDAWSEPGTEARAVFTHLPAFLWPRSYTFEVRTAPAGGEWSDEILRHTFRIRPAWWLRWYVVLPLLFLVATVLWSARRRG